MHVQLSEGGKTFRLAFTMLQIDSKITDLKSGKHCRALNDGNGQIRFRQLEGSSQRVGDFVAEVEVTSMAQALGEIVTAQLLRPKRATKCAVMLFNLHFGVMSGASQTSWLRSEMMQHSLSV